MARVVLRNSVSINTNEVYPVGEGEIPDALFDEFFKAGYIKKVITPPAGGVDLGAGLDNKKAFILNKKGDRK